MVDSPVLVAVAHGTRDPAGLAVLGELAEQVRAIAPGLTVELCFVDVAEPSLADTLDRIGDRPVVVVPVLLATGYHVRTDIPAVVAARQRRLAPIVVTAPIGPDEQLTRVVAERLAAVRRPDCEEVLLVSAGSSDPAAREQLAEVAGQLGGLLPDGPQVRFAQLTEADPFAGVGPHAAIANYLLAPGFFDDKLRRLAADRPVAAPIGAHPDVAALIVRRYRDASGAV